MLPLDGLNSDALNEIIQLVHDSSNHTLFSLLQVNKTFHDLTLPFVYRVLDFNFTQADHRRFTELRHDPYTRSQHRIRSITRSNPRILTAIRKVVVHSTFARWPGDTFQRTPFIPSDEDVESKWSLFVTFVSQIVHLRELVFNCRERLPPLLLDVLHSRHPLCRLHVHGWTRAAYDMRVGDPYEEALARSPCLRSIEASVIPGPPSTDLFFPAFSRIVSLAPKLESMGYSVEMLKSWRYILNHLTAEQRDEIRMESNRFNVKDPVRKGLKKIRWTSMDEDILEHFERAGLDLKTVESLDMGEVSCISGLIHARKRGLFTALKHLSFTVNHSSHSDCTGKELKAKIVDFLLSIQPLQSLAITNYSSFIDLSALLCRHGNSLRSLSLHEVEGLHEPREILTVKQLKELRLMAPNLEEIELDINRTADVAKQSAYYEVLGSFPQLYRVKIHYDLGLLYRSCLLIHPPKHLSQTYSKIDENFGRSVWRAIHNSKEKHGHAYLGIEEMTIFCGERRHCESRLGLLVGGRNSGHTLVLRANERDDKRDELHVRAVASSGFFVGRLCA